MLAQVYKAAGGHLEVICQFWDGHTEELITMVNQMFTNFPLDVAGNLDYKNLCYVITHGEDKEQE